MSKKNIQKTCKENKKNILTHKRSHKYFQKQWYIYLFIVNHILKNKDNYCIYVYILCCYLKIIFYIITVEN